MLFKISIIRVRARALTLALAFFCVQVNSLFHYNVFFYTLSAVDRFHWQAYASILLRLDSLSAFSVFQQHFYKHVVSTQGYCYNRQAETQRRGVAGTRASFLAPPPPPQIHRTSDLRPPAGELWTWHLCHGHRLRLKNLTCICNCICIRTLRGPGRRRRIRPEDRQTAAHACLSRPVYLMLTSKESMR